MCEAEELDAAVMEGGPLAAVAGLWGTNESLLGGAVTKPVIEGTVFSNPLSPPSQTEASVTSIAREPPTKTTKPVMRPTSSGAGDCASGFATEAFWKPNEDFRGHGAQHHQPLQQFPKQVQQQRQQQQPKQLQQQHQHPQHVQRAWQGIEPVPSTLLEEHRPQLHQMQPLQQTVDSIPSILHEQNRPQLRSLQQQHQEQQHQEEERQQQHRPQLRQMQPLQQIVDSVPSVLHEQNRPQLRPLQQQHQEQQHQEKERQQQQLQCGPCCQGTQQHTLELPRVPAELPRVPASAARQDATGQWECKRCTLINNPCALVCEACEAPGPHMDLAHATQMVQPQAQAAWSSDGMEHLPMPDPALGEVQLEEDIEHLPLREVVKPENRPRREEVKPQPVPPEPQHVDPPWLVSAPEVAMDMKRAMVMVPHNLYRADFDGARDEGPRVHCIGEPRPQEPAGLPPSALTFADVQAAARGRGAGRGRGAPLDRWMGQHQVAMQTVAGWPQTPPGWAP